MNVGALCSRRIVSASVSAPLSEVAALMQSARVGMVIVTHKSEGRLRVAGVITDRDIVRAQLTHVADFSQLSTEATMTSDPLLVASDEDLGDALRRMRARGVRRAPVIDSAGELVGALSVDDLLAQIAHEIVGLAAVVSRQSRSFGSSAV
jgi:CBS domain-containing protein